MNHMTALAVARGIQADRLEAARRRRLRPAAAPARPTRASHFDEMVRVLLMGFRHRPEPEPSR